MIIALEGGICSGKTTLAKGFEQVGFNLIPEYMDIILPIEEERINELTGSSQSALNVFLEIEKRRKEIYKDYLKGKNIVLDRSYLTLFAYEYAVGRDISRLKVQNLHENVIIPDLIIFLDINDALRKQRSNNRKDIDMPEIFLEHNFNKKLKQFFLKQDQLPCIFLNTENLTPSQMITSLRSIQINDKQQIQQLMMKKLNHQR